MRTGIEIEVSVADRARLEAIAADRNSPQKHGWRAGDRGRLRHRRDHAPGRGIEAQPSSPPPKEGTKR